jgi:hypothetical protein
MHPVFSKHAERGGFINTSWTSKGYNRLPVGLGSLFTLGLNLAKSNSLTTQKKEANHSL